MAAQSDRNESPRESPFAVPLVQHILGGLIERFRGFWIRLGRLETATLQSELAGVRVRMPVYVCGLARSGSTLLHEVIASHDGIATIRIKDYPMLFTPFWWRRATRTIPSRPPRERPHRDGIMITANSPDALEEMLWMAFFPRCHSPALSHVLGPADRNPDFESFYDAFIRKLLLAEGAARYCAKANYHVARLPYLLRLHPDAKFIIPVRSPESHVASLLRQHRLFSAGQREHPRSLAYMRRSGHFEFGLGRVPMNLGDHERTRAIAAAWAKGNDLRGFAMQWDTVYSYLWRLLETDPAVRAASLVVRHETLCDSPADTLAAVFHHCLLPNAASLIDRHSSGIRKRTYREQPLTAMDREAIRSETATTAARWGY